MIKAGAFLVMVLTLPQVGLADPCEEFETVNAGWMGVQSKVAGYDSGKPLEYEERRALTAAIAAQFDNSEALPWSFEDRGDELGAELAMVFVTGVKSLYRPIGEFHRNDDALAKSLDDIEAALGAIGEYCAEK